MILSACSETNEFLSCILSNKKNREISISANEISKTVDKIPVQLETFENCDCYGIIFFDDNLIGYTMMLNNILVIKLLDTYDKNVLLKDEITDMINSNIVKYKNKDLVEHNISTNKNKVMHLEKI